MVMSPAKKRTPPRKPARRRPPARKPAARRKPAAAPELPEKVGQIAGPMVVAGNCPLPPPGMTDARPFGILCGIDAWLKELAPGKDREDALMFLCRRHIKGYDGFILLGPRRGPAHALAPRWLSGVPHTSEIGTHAERAMEEMQRQAREQMS